MPLSFVYCLLIVTDGDYAEVADDQLLSDELGREIGDDENYWEATDCMEMEGLWMFDREAAMK